MKIFELLDEHPFLKNAYLSSLLLGLTDIIHHWHVASVLGDKGAIHAVWAGIVLAPVSALCVIGFLYSNKLYYFWGFVAIALLATIVPGFYHGGWIHMMKLLAFFRIEGESTNIGVLLPKDNADLWFYEITGSIEFVIAIVCAIYSYKLVRAKLWNRPGDLAQ